MTIIEALKSGKKFKRTGWLWVRPDKDIFFEISREDILATDWEIQEEPKKQWLAWASPNPHFRSAAGGISPTVMLYPNDAPDRSAHGWWRCPSLDPPESWSPDDKV